MRKSSGSASSARCTTAAASRFSASVSGSRGLSIYLPGAGQYYSGYSDLRFSQDYPTWNQMLQQVIQ